MDIRTFGSELIETLDLDPIYVLAVDGVPSDKLHEWILAYWCFYHAGVCSAIVQADAPFWDAMRYAEANRWPRGTERRHFRGQASASAIEYLAKRFPEPADAITSLVSGDPHPTFNQVAARIQEWPAFGPWIAFKAADMLERILCVPVDFSDCTLGIYRDPKKAAEMYDPSKTLEEVVDELVSWFAPRYNAPPLFDRPVNVQEVETILCKWKSHMNGHYPIGKDTKEIRHGLFGFGPLAVQLAATLSRTPFVQVGGL